LASEVGTTDMAKKQLLKMFPNDPLFDTPKPENLISRILEIATNPGDIVLDPFLGSGTTVAVAHKMGRSYIGIEINPDLIGLCQERLISVIEGDKSDGSTKERSSRVCNFHIYRVTS
jgi:adenine-specific DNA-methyltransferase